MNMSKEKYKHPVIVALLFAIIMVMLCFAINRFHIFYSTNDDYLISQQLAEGDGKSLFMSIFFSYPIMLLYKIYDRINWLVVIQIILNFFAVFVLNYIFLKKYSKFFSTFIVLGYNLLFINQCITIIQYSQTSTILIVTGFVCICSVLLWNIVDLKILFLTIASVFLIIGTSIRFYSLLPACLIFGIYLLSFVVLYILKKKNIQNLRLISVKKVIHAFVAIILISGVSLTINVASNAILNNDKQFDDYRMYNYFRQESVDYIIPPFSGNEDAYESLGITSQNDLDVLHNFTTDTAFFNTEKLKQISGFSNENWYGKRFFFRYFFDRLSSFMHGWKLAFLVVGFLGLLSIAFLAIKFRNKIKYVFPFIVASAFIPYFILFRLDYNFILAIPIVFFVLVTGFIFNRYHFFQMSLVVITCMSLILYMNFVRLNFRVAFNIFFPTIIILLGMMDCNNVSYRFMHSNIKQIIQCISCVLFLCIGAFSSVIIYKSEALVVNERTEIRNYIVKNNETLFIDERAGVGLQNYNNPLLTPSKSPNNLVSFGWSVYSPTYQNKLEAFNTNNLFEYMINNPKGKLLLRKDEFEKYKTYFKAHYGVNCEFSVDGEFEDVYVLSVVNK